MAADASLIVSVPSTNRRRRRTRRQVPSNEVRVVRGSTLVTGLLGVVSTFVLATPDVVRAADPLPACWEYGDGTMVASPPPLQGTFLGADGQVVFGTGGKVYKRSLGSTAATELATGVPVSTDATGQWVLVLGATLFMLDRDTGDTTTISDIPALYGKVLTDGDVVFQTTSVLDVADTDGVTDVYRWDRTTAAYSSVVPDGLTAGATTDTLEDASADGSVLMVRVGVGNAVSVLLVDGTNGTSLGVPQPFPSYGNRILLPSGDQLYVPVGPDDTLKRYDPHTATTTDLTLAGVQAMRLDHVSANGRYLLVSRGITLANGTTKSVEGVVDLTDTSTVQWLGISAWADYEYQDPVPYGVAVTNDGQWVDLGGLFMQVGTPAILDVDQPGLTGWQVHSVAVGRGASGTEVAYGINLAGVAVSGSPGLTVDAVTPHDAGFVDITHSAALDIVGAYAWWTVTRPGVCRALSRVTLQLIDVHPSGTMSTLTPMLRPGQGAAISLTPTPNLPLTPVTFSAVHAAGAGSGVVMGADAPPGWYDVTASTTWRGQTFSMTTDDFLFVRSAKGEFVAKSQGLYDTAHNRETKNKKLTSTKPLDLDVRALGNIPSQDLEAVAVQVRVTSPSKVGQLRLGPIGQTPVNMSYRPSRYNVSTLVVPVGSDGRIRLQLSAGTAHVKLTLVGYFGKAPYPDEFGGAYLSTSPIRAFDTKTWGYGKLDKKHYAIVPISAPGFLVSAVALSVTVTDATASGRLVVGGTPTWPTAATGNVGYYARETTTTTVIAAIGSSGGDEPGLIYITLTGGAVNIAVDVLGWWDNGSYRVADGQLKPVSPITVLNSAVAAGPTTIDLSGVVPADAAEVLVEVTGGAKLAGTLGVYPGDETSSPMTSTIAWAKKGVATGQSIVRLSPTKTIVVNPTTASTVTVKVIGWTLTR